MHRRHIIHALHFTLVKFTLGVNFTNVLQAAFTLADPESTKKLLDLTVIFCAFGVCGRNSCL